VRTVIVPDSVPKTKPKACNYGLSKATENTWSSMTLRICQTLFSLKKAYLGFLKAPATSRALQAKLKLLPMRARILTRSYRWVSLWFESDTHRASIAQFGDPSLAARQSFRTKTLLELLRGGIRSTWLRRGSGCPAIHKGVQNLNYNSQHMKKRPVWRKIGWGRDHDG